MNKNADCPVCSKHLNELGKKLPYAHCSQSRLICYMSGEALNEHNPPMMLPNGRVYGYNVSSKTFRLLVINLCLNYKFVSKLWKRYRFRLDLSTSKQCGKCKSGIEEICWWGHMAIILQTYEILS